MAKKQKTKPEPKSEAKPKVPPRPDLKPAKSKKSEPERAKEGKESKEPKLPEKGAKPAATKDSKEPSKDGKDTKLKMKPGRKPASDEKDKDGAEGGGDEFEGEESAAGLDVFDRLEPDDDEVVPEELEEEEEAEIVAPIAKPARPAKPAKLPPQRRGVFSSRSAARIKLTFKVFNPSYKEVASFEFKDRSEADALAAKLTEKSGKPHIVKAVRVPMENHPRAFPLIPKARLPVEEPEEDSEDEKPRKKKRDEEEEEDEDDEE